MELPQRLVALGAVFVVGGAVARLEGIFAIGLVLLVPGVLIWEG